MLVDRARTDGATAGQRHFGLAIARDQRTEHQDRRTHGAHEVVGRDAGIFRPRIDVHFHAIVEDHAHAHAAEQFNEGGDVVQVRYVADADRLVGKQAGSEDGQDGVLRAGNADLAIERLAAADQDLGHGGNALRKETDEE